MDAGNSDPFASEWLLGCLLDRHMPVIIGAYAPDRFGKKSIKPSVHIFGAALMIVLGISPGGCLHSIDLRVDWNVVSC